jgi:PAS domain S-box-containing protein
MGTGIELGDVVDGLADAVIAADTSNRIVYANRAALRLLGWPHDELVGSPLTTIVPARLREACLAAYRRFVDTHMMTTGGRPLRVPALCRDGSEVDVELTFSATTRDGIDVIVVSMRDMRDRVELERHGMTQRRLTAQYRVMAALAEANDMAEAAPAILSAIGEALDWDAGGLWLVDDDTGMLRCIASWCAADETPHAFGGFLATTLAARFARGVGLPGQTWERGEPVWVKDMVVSGLPRAAVAGDDGLHGGFAFPIRLGSAVLGAVEFFSREVREPDDDLLRTVMSLGGQIGQFAERLRVQAEQRRERGQFEFLSEATKALSLSLDGDEILRDLARLVVPRLGDNCVVDLLEPDGSVRRVAEAASDPAKEELLRRMRRYPIGLRPNSPVLKVLHTGQTDVTASFGETNLRALTSDDEYAALVRAIAPLSSVSVAIAHTGKNLGVITFGISTSGRRHSAADVALAEELGRRAGAALDNARVVRELAQAEQRAALIADALPQIVWTADTTGKILMRNRHWREYTGQPADVAREEVGALIMPSLQRAAVDERWRHSLATGEPYQAEMQLRRASDGAFRWHLALATPVRDAAGKIVMWVGGAVDIEDQKRTEDAARFLGEASAVLGSSLDYESTLRRLAQLAVPRLADWCTIHLADASHGAPRQLALAHASPEKVAWAQEIAQRYPPDSDPGRGISRVMHSGRPELYSDVTDEMLQAGARDAEHLRLLRQIGMRSAMALPLRAGGSTLGVLTLISAESGRRYTQTDLDVAGELARRAAHAVENARLYKEATRAIEVRDQFLSIASHELKTPLTPLQLHVQMLQKACGSLNERLLAERIGPKLDSISRQVSRLASLIDDLLDISRITAGRMRLEREQVDLCDVVREVGSRFAAELSRAGGDLRIDAPAPVVGVWDRLRLDQIVTNLLGNAIKFGMGKPIDVSVVASDGHATLTVRDHGIGIAPEDQARIFERFERAVAPRHYGGFGLGLWIVRQIVDALHGSISVDSRVGAGSVFTIDLPLQAPADEAEPAPTLH